MSDDTCKHGVPFMFECSACEEEAAEKRDATAQVKAKAFTARVPSFLMRSFTVVGETEKAMQLRFPSSPKLHWIPKSQIRELKRERDTQLLPHDATGKIAEWILLDRGV